MTVPYATPPTAVPGFGLPAADWNAKVRDSLENVAKPMRCKVNRNTSQSVGNAAISNIVWQNEEYDTDGIWTPGSTADSFIIPANGAGLWRFTLSAQWAINATGGRHFGLTKGAAGFATFNAPGSAAWYVGGSIMGEIVCAVGDVIKAYAYQTSGAALNIDVAYNVNFSAIQLAR